MSTVPIGVVDESIWHVAGATTPFRREGDLLFIAGMVAVDQDGQVLHPGDAVAQTLAILARMQAIIEDEGGTVADVVEVFAFVKDPRWCTDVLTAAGELFGDDGPAWSLAGHTGSWHPGALVTLKATAHLGPEAKRAVTPDTQAWRRKFPMSGAVEKGGLIWLSGQTAAGVDGSASAPFDHVDQSRMAYQGMRDSLSALGAGMDDILDFTSFHEDIRGALPTMDEVYIPEIMAGVALENSATTAHLGSTGLMTLGVLGSYRSVADTSAGPRLGCTPESIWWKGVLPIAGAARKSGGTFVTVAGHVACNPDSSVNSPGDSLGQAEYIFASMAESLEGVGASMADVIEVSSFHKDFRNVPGVIEVAHRYFGANAPAWTASAVPGLWMEGYLHEVSATAVFRG
jgi:enamine deaminase RidA (YjgF/YER057c/UK114 family)